MSHCRPCKQPRLRNFATLEPLKLRLSFTGALVSHMSNPAKDFHHLRTVKVTSAVHRVFGLPYHQVTNFLDLPALDRLQPPYMILRLCGEQGRTNNSHT
uniref:Uncharacterized protein n=1 Tax=Solanum lycopersicum TaxID=4081 RepID=A0A3Q7J5U1_SOLLC